MGPMDELGKAIASVAPRVVAVELDFWVEVVEGMGRS